MDFAEMFNFLFLLAVPVLRHHLFGFVFDHPTKKATTIIM